MRKSKIKSADLGDLPPGMHGMGDGLQFRVVAGKTGINRTWVLRFTLNGKADVMGLGRYPDVTESVARQRAEEYRRLAKQGIDPKAHRDARAETVKVKEVAAISSKSIAFKEMAERWIAAHRDEWSCTNPHYGTDKRYARLLTAHVYPLLGATPVREINTDLVLQVLEPIWRTLQSSHLVRNLMERVLQMATAHKYREGENPARWDLLKHLLPAPQLIHKKKNFAALPYQQIPAFMARLRSVDGRDARALELAILCGGRMDEIRSAKWSEFDFEARMWIIPARRTKTGKRSGQDHHVPLTDRAIEILNSMSRLPGYRHFQRKSHRDPLGGGASDYVFPSHHTHRQGTNTISTVAMLTQLRAICDYRDRDGDPVTVHGFRSTFNDWAADTTDFDRDTIQMQLSHAVAHGTEAAYRRGKALEKRRRLVDVWADYCAGKTNVIQMDQYTSTPSG
jgi:integrase